MAAPTDDHPVADDFDGTDLDGRIWLPHYRPGWSSRADTAASYRIQDFDFPAWSTNHDDHLVPELDVDWVRGD